MSRLVSRLIAIAATTAGALAFSAGVANAEPWVVKPITPAFGGIYLTNPLSPVATVQSSPSIGSFLVPLGTRVLLEITVENSLGIDGTLANDKRIATATLDVRDSNREFFDGRIDAVGPPVIVCSPVCVATPTPVTAAPLPPGNYFFQYSFQYGGKLYISQVFTFTIGIPTLPSPITGGTAAPKTTPNTTFRLTYASAYAVAKTHVRTRRGGTNTTARCLRDNNTRFTCTIRYKRSGKFIRAIIQVSLDRNGIHVT